MVLLLGRRNGGVADHEYGLFGISWRVEDSLMIRLLHLSDLHFGNHSRLAGKDHTEAGKSFHRALLEAEPSLAQEGQKEIDVVVVTGDLAEVGKPTEFALAYDFLRALAGEAGIDHHRFVFCPGNHDISRPLCRKVSADQEIEGFDEQEMRRRIDLVKLEFYRNFLADFYDTPVEAVSQPLSSTSAGLEAYVHSFPDLKLSIAALSSCEKESHLEEDHVGLLGEPQSMALMSYWQRGEAVSWLKIVAIHHNPTVTVPPNIQWWRQWLAGKQLSADQIAAWQGDVLGFEGRERLKRIAADCQVQLILHGHHHAKDEHVWPWRGNGYAHVLSAGSLSLVDAKLPGSEPASFRLIDLDPARATLRARSFVWIDWARTFGEVEPGAFKPDPDGPYEKALDLPQGYRKQAPRVGSNAQERRDLAAFTRTFRTAFRGSYSRWDLATAGVTQAGGAGRPITVGLDAMYIPLRLRHGYDTDYPNWGEVMTPEALLVREQPLAIRGAAGSGKTTWMRWTFRRLLDLEQALPLMLVLRDLAFAWSKASMGNERSLEAFLDAWAAEQIGSGWQKGYIKKLLETRDGPIPVLLVDGWDELGPLGEQVRSKLVGMMRLYPRLQVVVSSRPYGEGRPSHDEGFELLDLQPLSGDVGSTLESWGEIGQLTENFFQHCYLDEVGSKTTSTVTFLEALSRSADARTLARTPLLLTMMLLISRSRPLPDKRHDLYEACIDNLLTARTERKEREGALLLHEQWRPDDSDQRKRALAELAHGLQDTQLDGPSEGRKLITTTWERAADALPAAWSHAEKYGFLAWLGGPAGLLVDRSDGTLTYTHLSFQEYLTAWHLDATVEGAGPRIEVFRRHAGSIAWRETLRLWAARIDKQNPQRVDEVIEALQDSQPGLLLAGFIFADGLGTESTFQSWLTRCLDESPELWLDAAKDLSWAWRASQQQKRRDLLLASVKGHAPKVPWLPWLGLNDFFAATFGDQPLTAAPVPYAMIMAHHGRKLTPEITATGRLHCGDPPLWPDPYDVGLLNLWPGSRRLMGLRIQGLITSGGDPHKMEEGQRDFFWPARQATSGEPWSTDLARDLSHDLYGSLRDKLPTGLNRDLVSDVARYLLSCGPNQELVLDLFYNLVLKYRESQSGLGGEFADRFAGNFQGGGRTGSSLAHLLERAPRNATKLENQFGADLANTPWFIDFMNLEVVSVGRLLGRSVVRHHQNSTQNPQLALLSAACQLTDAPQGTPTSELDRALEKHSPSLHPLWPALARHLARRGDAADRQLLESLAREPEQVDDGPLRWGLRFIVRGDVMLPDGSFATLDSLGRDLGRDPLPYLEDPPIPLAVEWSEE